MICKDDRECFARGAHRVCTVLTNTYENGKCPFCKPVRNISVVNGKEVNFSTSKKKGS